MRLIAGRWWHGGDTVAAPSGSLRLLGGLRWHGASAATKAGLVLPEAGRNALAKVMGTGQAMPTAGPGFWLREGRVDQCVDAMRSSDHMTKLRRWHGCQGWQGASRSSEIHQQIMSPLEASHRIIDHQLMACDGSTCDLNEGGARDGERLVAGSGAIGICQDLVDHISEGCGGAVGLSREGGRRWSGWTGTSEEVCLIRVDREIDDAIGCGHRGLTKLENKEICPTISRQRISPAGAVDQIDSRMSSYGVCIGIADTIDVVDAAEPQILHAGWQGACV